MSENASPQHTQEEETTALAQRLALPAQVEALLFVADEPVTIQQLAQTLDADEDEVRAALEQVEAWYSQRGLRVQRQNGSVQMVTAPEAAPFVEKFLGLALDSRLSAAAVETLALIAYRQPITRGQLETIRGVSCDGVLRTLLSRGLIVPVGRLEQAGRPIVYGTTFEFLQYFGLSDLSQLPSIEELRPSADRGDSDEP